MNTRAIENHRLVMLARAAAQHGVEGNTIEYVGACALLVDMARAEAKAAADGMEQKQRERTEGT